MDYKERFEDDGFVYELQIQSATNYEVNLRTHSQNNGYYCEWIITQKEKQLTNQLVVTDDDCNMIVYYSLEAAVSGARQFLSL